MFEARWLMYVLTAVVVWGVQPIVQKYVGDRGVRGAQATMVALMGNALTTVLLNVLTAQVSPKHIIYMPWHVLGLGMSVGAMSSIANYFFGLAVLEPRPGVGPTTSFGAMYPTVTFILSVLCLQQSASLWNVLGVVFSLFGVVCFAMA